MRRSLLDKFGAFCWRCGWPIYEGQPWEKGHTVPRWLEGKEVRPEHKWCNRADAPVQQRAKNKTDRIIKNNGLKPDYSKREKKADRPKSRWPKKRYNKETKRWETVR